MTAYPDLRDSCVLITGGATGIGEAMVRAFVAQSAIVHFCDVDSVSGKRLAREMGESAVFHPVDLRVEAQVRRWIRRVRRTQPAIRVLINNAASDPRIPLEDCSLKQWDDLFARNLRAFFLTAREAVPHMPPGAAIVNFSSITVHAGPPNMSAYVATKAGIQGLTRSLARELGPRRIRVNTLSPGWIMTRRQLRQYVSPAVKRLIKRSQCIPDLIQPADIADIALFLASNASRAITGQELLSDRGWMHS